MATFYADSTGAYVPARSGTGTITVPFQYVCSTTTALAIDDIVVLCKLPPYATLVGFIIDLPDIGDAGTCHIGTLSDPDRFVVSAVMTTAKRISSYDAAATANTHVLLEKIPFRVLDTDSGDVTVADDLRLTMTVAQTVPIAATIRGFAQYVCGEAQAMAETAVAVP